MFEVQNLVWYTAGSGSSHRWRLGHKPGGCNYF